MTDADTAAAARSPAARGAPAKLVPPKWPPERASSLLRSRSRCLTPQRGTPHFSRQRRPDAKQAGPDSPVPIGGPCVLLPPSSSLLRARSSARSYAAQGSAERVVLLDDDGGPTGTMLKSEVHGPRTPLHQAFSTWGFDTSGRVLLTRRATTKTAWPGVWTNTCCGHPAPGESLIAAVTRRLDTELGMAPVSLTTVLPDFRYRATDASGVVENEICPVLFVELDGDPAPLASEVAGTQWVDPERVVQLAQDLPFMLSPWAVLQIAELTSSGRLGPSAG